MQDGDIVSLVVLFIVIAFISLVAWAVPVRLYIEALSAGACEYTTRKTALASVLSANGRFVNS